MTCVYPYATVVQLITEEPCLCGHDPLGPVPVHRGPKTSAPSTSAPSHGERERNPCPHKRTFVQTRVTSQWNSPVMLATFSVGHTMDAVTSVRHRTSSATMLKKTKTPSVQPPSQPKQPHVPVDDVQLAKDPRISTGSQHQLRYTACEAENVQQDPR